MLSFGLKIAWFVLSLTGLLCSTIALWAFGSALNSRWGPLLFCFGNILVQGMFCLGMIYRMDPFSMPRSFCLVQSILVSFGADLLAGVTLAFSIATYLAVLKPKTWSDATRALQWRNMYALPIMVVPILASTAQSVVVLKMDTFAPMDGMQCDSTSPLWPRMLGYAGIPLIISLPSIYLSTMSILQIRKTNNHLQRARPDSFTDFKKSGPRLSSSRRRTTSKSRRTRTRNISFMQNQNTDNKSIVSPSTPPTITTTNSDATIATNPTPSPPPPVRQYHLPFRPPSFHSTVSASEERSKSNLSGRIGVETTPQSDIYLYRDDASSRVSVTFPTFVNPPLPASAVVSPRDREDSLGQKGMNVRRQGDKDINMDVIRVSVNGSVMMDVDQDGPGDWSEDKERDWSEDNKLDDDLDLGSDSDLHDVYAMYDTELRMTGGGGAGGGKWLDRRMDSVSPLPYRKHRKEFPTLSPIIWWIIFFQLAYTTIPVFSSLSTLIDMITQAENHNHRPASFGTQHVALLLAAWGPAFVFGHLPIVRSYLLPGWYAS